MDMPTFLAHAVRLESEAVRISEGLADLLKARGDDALEAFYREMAGHSRQHLKSVLDRAGRDEVAELAPEDYRWPDGFAPESLQWGPMQDITDADRAMALALNAERRGFAFYRQIAVASAHHDVQALAAQFAAEEAEHVTAMERIIGTRSY